MINFNVGTIFQSGNKKITENLRSRRNLICAIILKVCSFFFPFERWRSPTQRNREIRCADILFSIRASTPTYVRRTKSYPLRAYVHRTSKSLSCQAAIRSSRPQSREVIPHGVLKIAGCKKNPLRRRHPQPPCTRICLGLSGAPLLAVDYKQGGNPLL